MMKRMTIVLALAIAAVACTPNHQPAGGQASGRTIHPADVAAALRQHGFTVTGAHPADPAPLYAVEADEGTVNGADSAIATFGNVAGREAWLEMVTTFGRAAVVGSGDRPGDLWGVNPSKEQGGLALAAKIAGELGGHTVAAQA
jgi:hypothetical protein